jgi:hypothetical protein
MTLEDYSREVTPLTVEQDVCGEFSNKENASQPTISSSSSVTMSSISCKSKSSSAFPEVCMLDVRDHLASMLGREGETMPEPAYFDIVQNGKVKPIFRRHLAVWLTSFIEEYSLSPYTVPTALNYLDRYLSVRPTSKTTLPLVAVVCVFIASKFHDVQALSLDDLLALKFDDGPYTVKHFVKTEQNILLALKWNLHPVCSHNIAHYLVLIGSVPDIVKTQANAALDLAMCDSHFISFLPSTIACAAIKVAASLNGFNYDSWSKQVNEVSPLDLQSESVRTCSEDLMKALIVCFPSLSNVARHCNGLSSPSSEMEMAKSINSTNGKASAPASVAAPPKKSLSPGKLLPPTVTTVCA